MRFFAPASLGTEEVLAGELGAEGIPDVEVQRGGVAFGSALEHGYRACLWSRVASRILLPLERFGPANADEFYERIFALDWTAHLGPERTFAIDAAGGRSPVGPPHFAALKAKDAIVDRIRDAEGERPSVDAKRPDLRIHLHLTPERATVSIDLAGRGLHRRGIGRTSGMAPLKESLAAALLRLAGWPDAAGGLLDPFCGSGTILLEAAWMALDVAPGLRRRRHGFNGWRGHDGPLWQRLLGEARERRSAARGRKLQLYGSDSSEEALAAAAENFKRARLGGQVRLARRPAVDARPPWPEPGLIVTNPPYGERLGEAGELGPLYERFGDNLKRNFPGWTAWILSGNPALYKRIGLKPASRRPLYNGPIECRLLEIPIGERGRGDAPGWRKPRPEAAGFEKRLRKNLTARRKVATREQLGCYRLYDADVPEYNLSVDWYDGAVRVEEYARPAKVDPAAAERRLRDAMLVVPEVCGVSPDDVSLRVRRRREEGSQYERYDDRRRTRVVREGDLRFLVNLTDYLDTGLFLDDREIRRWLRERADGKRFLNLFAYTCAASVAAAKGGGRGTTSVDRSKRYLAWGRDNFAANDLGGRDHRFVCADVLADSGTGGPRYDLIYAGAPTYARSKDAASEFDVQRDHGRLLRQARRRLAPGGELLFSTNRRDFELAEPPTGLEEEDLTAELTPFDFAARPRLKVWVFRNRVS